MTNTKKPNETILVSVCGGQPAKVKTILGELKLSGIKARSEKGFMGSRNTVVYVDKKTQNKATDILMKLAMSRRI